MTSWLRNWSFTYPETFIRKAKCRLLREEYDIKHFYFVSLTATPHIHRAWERNNPYSGLLYWLANVWLHVKHQIFWSSTNMISKREALWVLWLHMGGSKTTRESHWEPNDSSAKSPQKFQTGTYYPDKVGGKDFPPKTLRNKCVKFWRCSYYQKTKTIPTWDGTISTSSLNRATWLAKARILPFPLF